jgi:membrane-bound lytic murein transglycosylase MltF
MNLLKQFLLLSVLIIISKPSTAQQLVGQSWQDVKKNKSGTISVIYHSQSRLIYLEKNEMRGLYVDILNDFLTYVKDKYQVNLQVKYLGENPVFGELLKTIENSQNVLGLANVTINEERKKWLLFTPPFLNMPPVLVTHKNTNSITSPSQLNILSNYTAIVVRGSTYTGTIAKMNTDNNLQIKWENGESSDKILFKIHSQPKSFSVVDLIEYIGAVQKQLDVKAHKVRIADSEQLGFIMSLKSDWQLIWEEFLTEEYRQSPHYRKLIQDNLGQAFLKLM